MFRQEVLWFSLCSLSLGLSKGTTEKSVSLLFSPSLQVFLHTDELPWVFPSPGWSPSFLSLSSERRCSRSLIPFEALCWTSFPMSTSLIVGSWAQHCCCALTSAEGRASITSLNVQATLVQCSSAPVLTSVQTVTEGLLVPWGKHKGTDKTS